MLLYFNHQLINGDKMGLSMYNLKGYSRLQVTVIKDFDYQQRIMSQ